MSVQTYDLRIAEEGMPMVVQGNDTMIIEASTHTKYDIFYRGTSNLRPATKLEGKK